ncbi:unnamed protein product [Lampetra fluviatilis]
MKGVGIILAGATFGRTSSDVSSHGFVVEDALYTDAAIPVVKNPQQRGARAAGGRTRECFTLLTSDETRNDSFGSCAGRRAGLLHPGIIREPPRRFSWSCHAASPPLSSCAALVVVVRRSTIASTVGAISEIDSSVRRLVVSSQPRAATARAASIRRRAVVAVDSAPRMESGGLLRCLWTKGHGQRFTPARRGEEGGDLGSVRASDPSQRIFPLPGTPHPVRLSLCDRWPPNDPESLERGGPIARPRGPSGARSAASNPRPAPARCR